MSEHTNSLLRIRAAQLHARLEEAATAHQQLTAENAKLRAELAEAVGLLHDLPDMMGGDNWGDFLTLDDERRVLAVIEAKHAATA